MSLLMTTCLFADANIEIKNSQKTFLLTAPGTITGVREGQNRPAIENSVSPPARPMQQRRYNYVGEKHFNIPQYGQQPGQNNPWLERRPPVRPRLPGPASPYRSSYTNPWHMEGAQPPGLDSVQSRSFPFNPSEMISPNLYGEMGNIYSGFNEGVFRDSNPAAMTPPMNGFFPGSKDNNFALPFSPFGMFE